MDDFNIIDTHFHIWDLTRLEYKWPTAAEQEIFRNVDITEYEEEQRKTGVHAGVFVEAQNSVQETKWMIELLKDRKSVAGIVGYAHTGNPSLLEKELVEFTKEPKFVGVRNIIPLEEPGWLGKPGVEEGMKILEKFGLAYDLLIKKENFQDAIRIVRNNPKNRFVIDHLAKPNAKTGETSEWFTGMETLAQFDNVHCKLSGMVTEANLQRWRAEDFTSHVQHVLHRFGVDRVMFGSDWPVCKLANANLVDVYELMDKLLVDHSQDRKKIFQTNAISFYKLKNL